MTFESDLPEDDRSRQLELSAAESDDAARRYTSDQSRPGSDIGLDEHSRRDAAIARCAEILKDWDRADPLTREKLLNAVGREMMAIYEAPAPDLLTQAMRPGYRGAYAEEDFTMTVNRDLLDGDIKDALHTYLHEYRHSEQAYEIQKSYTPLRSTENTLRASALEANEKTYIDPEEDFDKYRQQLLERDANQFADANTEAIVQRMRAAPFQPQAAKT